MKKKRIVKQTGHSAEVLKKMSKVHGTSDDEIRQVLGDRNIKEDDLKAAGYSRAARRAFFHNLKKEKKS